MDLSQLSAPFPPEDVKWRVSRAGMGSRGIYCNVLAYITARAIQSRLDEVCGPENWRNEPMTVHELRPGVVAMQVGLSIRCGDGDRAEWVTKWDVCEPGTTPNIDPGKSGFSGAIKRAGAQWGIGRALYRIPETFAEVAESGGRGWNYARLSKNDGGATYYWKTPQLPEFALPKEPEHEISPEQLSSLKSRWRAKFAADVRKPATLRDGFADFVVGVVGEFPSSDYTCWTVDALEKCLLRIEATTEPDGPDSDVPFG